MANQTMQDVPYTKAPAVGWRLGEGEIINLLTLWLGSSPLEGRRTFLQMYLLTGVPSPFSFVTCCPDYSCTMSIEKTYMYKNECIHIRSHTRTHTHPSHYTTPNQERLIIKN